MENGEWECTCALYMGGISNTAATRVAFAALIASIEGDLRRPLRVVFRAKCIHLAIDQLLNLQQRAVGSTDRMTTFNRRQTINVTKGQ